MPDARNIESIVLRESIRARTSVAPVSIVGTFLSIFFFIPFLLDQGVAYPVLILWAGPIIFLMVGRGILSKWIKQRLDQSCDAELIRADRMLRISSIVNQVTVGMGIWIVRSPDDTHSYTVPLFMTLIVVIWSIGVLANLFSDFRTFIASMPLMIGQNAAFWILQGDIGVSIGVSMLLAASLMVLLVHRGAAIFRDSILMRFEKDQLLAEVENERIKTVEALREAREANDSKVYFMAAASHDIKQPLQALGMLTDTLLMSDPPESAIPILKTQRDSIEQMSAQFDALMDMGKLHGGNFALTLNTFRLSKFYSRINSEVAPLCDSKGLAWNLEIEDALVSTDEELLLRLVRNLLNNAVRFTDSGQVSCRAKVEGSTVNFLISDTGCGIPIEQQGVVFKEFVRLDYKGSRSSGAGLGLSIVEKIDRALNLDLQMSSTPGKGTQFSFHIPAVSERFSASLNQ